MCLFHAVEISVERLINNIQVFSQHLCHGPFSSCLLPLIVIHICKSHDFHLELLLLAYEVSLIISLVVMEAIEST